MNEVTITTRSGSWLLYDCLSLETPPGLETTQVSGTAVNSVQSPPYWSSATANSGNSCVWEFGTMAIRSRLRAR